MFVTVTLPLALPGIIAGMVLCFAKALGEFGATITFVSNIPGETQTHLGGDLHLSRRCPAATPPRGGSSIVAIVIALVALIASEWLARRAGTRCHGLTMLSVDVEKQLGDFAIAREVRGGGRRRPRCSARPARARPRSST